MNDRSRETDRAAQETEASFVFLAAWVVLAILGLCLIFTNISTSGGALLIIPFPALLVKRFADKKKRTRLREEQVWAHNETKNRTRNSN